MPGPSTVTFPLNDALVDERRRITSIWMDQFVSLFTSVRQAPAVNATPVSLTAQGAAIGSTTVASTLVGGMYRINAFAIITQAATTSSSLTVTLSWTTNGVAQSLSGAAMTGNTTTTWQSLIPFVSIDVNTPVSYSTAYLSTGATPMAYDLCVVLESVAV